MAAFDTLVSSTQSDLPTLTPHGSHLEREGDVMA